MNRLSHTSWECKYHIVFAPKYRRQVIYGKMKAEIGKILRELCDRKGIESIAAEYCPNHIHILLPIPSNVSEIIGYLKGKSAFTIFDRYASLKYKYGNRTGDIMLIQWEGIQKRFENMSTISEKKIGWQNKSA